MAGLFSKGSVWNLATTGVAVLGGISMLGGLATVKAPTKMDIRKAKEERAKLKDEKERADKMSDGEPLIALEELILSSKRARNWLEQFGVPSRGPNGRPQTTAEEGVRWPSPLPGTGTGCPDQKTCAWHTTWEAGCPVAQPTWKRQPICAYSG